MNIMKPAKESWKARAKADLAKFTELDDRGWTSEPFEIYLVILIALTALPITLGAASKTFTDRLADIACLPSGEFAVAGTIRNWDFRFLLSITAGFGNFSFAVAKGIDISWDLVVGRGGQLILAWIAYRIFSRAIVHAMEDGGVSCETYSAVAFHTGTLECTWTLLKDFLLGRYTKTWFRFFAYGSMIVTSVYVGLFPTVLSAMTSYGPISIAEAAYGNVSAPFSEWRPCFGLLLDGARVGYNEPFIIPDIPYNTSEGDAVGKCK